MAEGRLAGWPAGPGAAREAKILEAVRAGTFQHPWCQLDLTDGMNTLRIFVSCDALKIDGVRVNANAKTQQRIADELGALLLTPKLVDQIWIAAGPKNRLRPRTLPISSATSVTIQHSDRVDQEAAGTSTPPALANVGKDWVMSLKLFTPGALKARKAVNYGWLGERRTLATDERAVFANAFVIQGVGTFHNSGDDGGYSQTLRFVRRDARFNEQPVDLADVYTGAAPGNSLVSHEGPLPSARLPGLDGPEPPPPPRPPPAPSGAAGSSSAGPTAVVGAGIGAALGAVAGSWPLGALIGGILGFVAGRR